MVRHPVRAKIVTKAEEYPWSSARAHCELNDDPILSQKLDWKQQCKQISDWSAWLADGDDSQKLEMLRRNVEKGLPCGAEKFIRGLEKLAGRPLHYRPIGRPKHQKG